MSGTFDEPHHTISTTQEQYDKQCLIGTQAEEAAAEIWRTEYNAKVRNSFPLGFCMDMEVQLSCYPCMRIDVKGYGKDHSQTTGLFRIKTNVADFYAESNYVAEICVDYVEYWFQIVTPGNWFMWKPDKPSLENMSIVQSDDGGMSYEVPASIMRPYKKPR